MSRFAPTGTSSFASRARTCEQRVTAYAESLTSQAREEGRIADLTGAIKKIEATILRAKGGKTGAEKILWAVRGLLPAEAALRREIAQAKDQGYRAGQQTKR